MTQAVAHPNRRSRLWSRLLLVPEALIAICLLTLATAPLAAPASPPPAFDAEVSSEEEGGSEEELELEECFEAEEELCEEEEEEETGTASSTDKCFLRSAQAHAAKKHDKLKVTVGYTTNRPVGATIEIRQGATHLGTFKRHLNKSGVLRLASKLPKQHSGITVSIHPSQGAGGCPSRRLVLFPH